MNERIKNLVTSNFYPDCNGYILTTPESITDFAELIVRECAIYAFSNDQDYYTMLNHFGVKE